MPKLKLACYFSVFAATALLLSGCGFQLRGNYILPFKRLALISPDLELSAKIRRIIENSSQTQIVNSVDSADAILSISEACSTKIVPHNADGQLNDHELNYTMSYQLIGMDGTVLLPFSMLHLNRSTRYSDQNVLSKLQEYDVLYRDMSNEAVSQLLWCISVMPAPNLNYDRVRSGITHTFYGKPDTSHATSRKRPEIASR
ncbi:LPS-assembly lipoprotein LptE [Candidatus Vallotiella sp. (ex Adelges kitamiensis)]|uniref:LPS-assembly lipoprotein LptE n=1 Tax=Candidatus Vallotiella sp. (ex Adelges kitamiensis) TaxID=2864217 RepID=UPI001CE285A8|nr:LPS assembly lipoprotein LptE [Candidatus Vallotia sp. (ex Adelges kitamiensis)]